MNTIFPERRQSRRYLTLKNAAITGIVVVAAFILLSVWSGLRPSHGASGNLFEPRALASESSSAHRDPVPIVQEGSIDDHPGADPILLDAPPAAEVSTAASSASENFEPRESQLGKGKQITISGGPEGVQMHVDTAPASASMQTAETAAPAHPGQPPQSQ